jgi:hypothetical protein
MPIRLATNSGCSSHKSEITLWAMQDFVGLDACNDTNYLPPRHRTLPIQASVTPIANYPSKLRIFLTNASRYWQVRCYLKGKTYTQSLKTTNKQAAISQAKQFFHIKTAELYVGIIKASAKESTKFSQLVPEVMAFQQARVKRGELSAASIPIFQNRIQKTILPFFGEMPVNQIGFKELSDFVERISDQGFSTTTIQQHMVAVRKVLVQAQSLNLIQHIPRFPSIKIVNKPRGSFSLAEYRALVRIARQQVGKRMHDSDADKSRCSNDMFDRYTHIANDLHWMIRFMVNGFMRPSDIKLIQHKHVTVVRGKHIYLRLNLPETKKHDKPIVTLQPAVFVYERLLSKQIADGYGRPDDYLFLPELENRRWLLPVYGWQFKYIQSLAGVTENAANGQTRTIYSLRHTAMTFRLLYGKNIDLLTLARNARTSVDMIERFYASNLNAEMNIDLLQSKRT